MRRTIALLLTLALCLGAAAPAIATGATFTDVPATHWAYVSIERAVSEKWVYGVGGGLYRPDGTTTNGQLVTMLVRAFYQETYDRYVMGTGNTSIYTSYVAAANNDVLMGTSIEHSQKDKYDRIADLDLPASRLDMAQMMSNILYNHGLNVTPAQLKQAQMQIRDWNSIPEHYQTAVASVYAFGVISGQADGTFGGQNTMTRAQAATILCRLDDAVGNHSTGTADPSTPPAATPKPELPPEPTTTPKPSPETTDVQALTAGVIKLVNEARVQAGLPALQTDTNLTDAAQIRGEELVDLFSHTRPNGEDCFTVLKEANVDLRHTSAGENIAGTVSSPEAAMRLWMDSPGHRANILSQDFTHIGVGYCDGYWVQFFVG